MRNFPTHRFSLPCRAVLAAAAALVFSAPVFAETFTWSSSATTNSWNLASNWINSQHTMHKLSFLGSLSFWKDWATT